MSSRCHLRLRQERSLALAVFTRKVLERLQAEMNQIRATLCILAGNQKTVNGYLSTGYELCDNVMLKMNKLRGIDGR